MANYYCLMASLPTVKLTDAQPHHTLQQLKEELPEILEPQDARLIERYFLRFDCDNLVALLAFWSYVILGMDFDSFASLGGEPFFQEAQNIVSQAQGMLGDSWRARDDDRNCWGWMNCIYTTYIHRS